MRVLITDFGFPNVDQERSLLTAAGAEVATAQCRTPAEVVAAGRDADVLLVQWAPIDRSVIAALDHCRLIVRYGIGVDNVDLRAAGERGIPVCNVPDYCIDEVADHTLALALALARQVPQTDAAVRSGTWKITPPGPIPGFRGSIFATVGFGRIARAVLSRAAAFGFVTAAYDPFLSPDAFAETGVRPLSLDALLATAGVISLHLPLNAETRHFIHAGTLARMRRDALIVNTARGGLIDTVALAAALEARALGGAGLDVFETEPLPPDHPLRSAPNVLLTSHTAWYSAASIPELQRKAAEAAVRALTGQPLRNVVNEAFLSPAR
ncbi:MAG: C-terminal binding protein [Opitutaceae bacterium]|nr:C-terminal binding protein [Opitutaceae bacterium]